MAQNWYCKRKPFRAALLVLLIILLAIVPNGTHTANASIAKSLGFVDVSAKFGDAAAARLERVLLKYLSFFEILRKDAKEGSKNIEPFIDRKLKRISEIIKVSGSDVFNRLEQLQNDFFQSANGLMACTAVVATNEVEQGFVRALNTIAKSKPTVDLNLLGFIRAQGELKIDKTKPMSLIDRFEVARENALRFFESVTADTKPSIIRKVYTDLELGAFNALCRSPLGSGNRAFLMKEYFEYSFRLQLWNRYSRS